MPATSSLAPFMVCGVGGWLVTLVMIDGVNGLWRWWSVGDVGDLTWVGESNSYLGGASRSRVCSHGELHTLKCELNDFSAFRICLSHALLMLDTRDVMQSLLRGCDEFTWVQLKLRLSATWRGNLLVIMSSATSAVTYTSVYTDSEPDRAFWGADAEEVSEGGILRVIVLGYDGLPIQPVAPPSPDYIPGPEDPQTPLVPQDEDEREPMFVQAHDPDYVPKPIYPEYIPLEDDHEFLAEEQPLPPIDSPTAESPGYVTESDPEEDLEEYEDDETEDDPVDYPMDGGDDGDDDDGDSSGDDANDEDEDDEDEEEEEHLAPADSAVVVPADEPISPPKGTEPIIPPPSTDITIGARITRAPCKIKIGESSTARPTRGRGVDYGFVSTVDAEARRQGISEVGYGIRILGNPAEQFLKISNYDRVESQY
ncbi:hypothetical protein Tco_1069695 [Tanacetum coccineum]|uniref:Uncharacterized protein n=1 Tax=Tanacetum coccineum TaxID=301880 RepID=A0ABQ5HJ95_9ASTR